jgi:hypothetical protein
MSTERPTPEWLAQQRVFDAGIDWTRRVERVGPGWTIHLLLGEIAALAVELRKAIEARTEASKRATAAEAVLTQLREAADAATRQLYEAAAVATRDLYEDASRCPLCDALCDVSDAEGGAGHEDACVLRALEIALAATADTTGNPRLPLLCGACDHWLPDDDACNHPNAPCTSVAPADEAADQPPPPWCPLRGVRR